MPIGSYTSIPLLASHLILQRPSSVLDLGIGFGMTGAVVRQWLDEARPPYRTTLYGVEIWPAYRSPLWDLYDAVFVQPIEEAFEAIRMQFDLIVLADVIEHFPLPQGEQVLLNAQRKLTAGGFLYVATPARPMPQGAVGGNPHETHRSHWSPADLARRGFEILLCEADSQPPPAIPALAARWRKPR